MNKMMTVKGWLVVAAALTMGLTACTNDDNLTEAPVQPTNTSTMHVTVGAGIGDGTTTRATVDDSQTDGNGKTLRTLKFTDGDQLYVRYGGTIGDYGYDIYGILTTTGSSIDADGLTAQFSGDLTVQKWSQDEGEIPDPDLSQLTDSHFACLIPADHGASLVLEDSGYGIYNCFYREGLTATETLNEAVARHSYVSGEIDASQNVTLTAESAFLNCTVTGLDASTAYDVRMAKGADPVSVTTDGDGALHFVAWYRTEGGPMQYAFYVGNNKRVLLGEKTLTAGKVYNVNRAATAFTPLTVTDNATSTTVEPEWGRYSFKDGSADITVTGEGEGETISLFDNNNTVTLSGVTATSYETFIYASGDNTGTLNIVLSGTNRITVTDGSQAIHAEGNLKLSGNGTLTVTVTAADFYGLYGSSNYASFGGDPNNGDASVLAADGYTVTRSDVTHDSEKGTYTWTYTVAAPPALGDLYYSDGTYSTTLVAGKTPIGVIAYLDQAGTDDDEITESGNGGGHGLVLCLKNAASNLSWSTNYSSQAYTGNAYVTDAAGLTRLTGASGYNATNAMASVENAATVYPAAYQAKNYTGLAAPATGTTGWFLPSAQQWVKMQQALGGMDGSTVDKTIQNLGKWFDNEINGCTAWETALAKAGSGNYDSMTPYLWYFSSSEHSEQYTILLTMDGRKAGTAYGFCWSQFSKVQLDNKSRVRPALAF